jgi:hypothetical protein
VCRSVNRCACNEVARTSIAAKRKVKCFILCESGFDGLKKVNLAQLFAESENKERGIPFGIPLFINLEALKALRSYLI